jgi:hypothetical protein
MFVRMVADWLRHYATSRKVAGSRPDEVNDFSFSIYLIFPAAPGPGVYSVSKIIFLTLLLAIRITLDYIR